MICSAECRFRAMISCLPNTPILREYSHKEWTSYWGAGQLLASVSAHVFAGGQTPLVLRPPSDGEPFHGNLVLSVEGNIGVVGSSIGTRRDTYVYNLTTGEMLRQFGGNIFHLEDGVLYMGAQDKIHKYDVLTGADLGTIQLSTGGISHVRNKAFDMTTNSISQGIHSWDRSDGEWQWTFLDFPSIGATDIMTAASDDRVLLADSGTPLDIDTSPLLSGSAVWLDAATGNQIDHFTAPDIEEGMFFGYSVSIDGDVALIGAPGPGLFDIHLVGSVYVYNALSGGLLQKFSPASGQVNESFGADLDLHASTAIVGSPTHRDSQGDLVGAAYLFNALTGAQLGRYQSPNNEARSFGNRVAVGDQFILITGQIPSDGLVVYAYQYSLPPACPADLTGDNTLDFFDIAAFLTVFSSGCP